LEITLNKKNSTEGLIKIRVTEGDYQPHVEEKVKDYARKANIKGFRQGKVPTGVIKKMFGKSILVEKSIIYSRTNFRTILKRTI
jgi:trigger factor